jgi:hypothetical protein
MMGKSEVEVFKSSFPGTYENIVESVQEPLKKEIESLQSSVKAMQEANSLREMHELAKSMHPDPATYATTLLELRKSLSPEAFEAHCESQRQLFSIVQKSEAFTQMSSGRGAEVTAEIEIERMATEIVAKSVDGDQPAEVRKANAIKFVIDNNPELAARYHSEMSRRAAVIGMEE